VKSILFFLIALCAATANAASIGLFSDRDCGSCNLVIPTPGGSATLYVQAVGISGSEFCGGLTGAEFRVVGLPVGWSAVSTPSPLVIVSIGDPFGAGSNLGVYPPVSGGCIAFFSVVLTGDTRETVLHVERHANPANPNYQCPNVQPGDPCDGRICVDGGTLFVNSASSCTVGVTRHSWERVKGLYK
jgi:hypothetical protein